jgi:D-alanyl-D-alanine carboxypeptidase
MALLVEYLPARAARALQKLNVRSEPSTQIARQAVFESGAGFLVDALFDGEALLGISRWLRVAGKGLFVWAGAVELPEPNVPAAMSGASDPVVRRRADGTIAPIPVNELPGIFGKFDGIRPGRQQGSIEITTPADWVASHIVEFDHEILRSLGRRPQPVNRLAKPHLQVVFDEIVARGLDSRILSFDGAFVSRHKNWDPTQELSSHSWGIAIDLNQRFNGSGSEPALPGATGCLRELVPIFNARGFAWGGHFRRPRDGMHFELARTNL